MHSFASIAATGLLALPLVAALPSTKQSLNKRFTGEGTHYTAGLGACGWTNSNSEAVAAISAINWSKENPCGKEIMVTGPKGSMAVYLRDKCPECPENDIDLSPSAFEQIVGDLGLGRKSISWEYTGNIDPDPAPNFPNLDRSGGKVEEPKTTAEAPQPTYVAPPQETTPVKEEPTQENPGNNYAEVPEPEPTTTSQAPEPVVTTVPAAPTATVVPDTTSNTPDYNNNEEEEKKKNGNGQNGQNGQEGKKPKCGSKGYKHRKRHARRHASHARK